MTAPKRAKRPELPRSEPIRGWSTLFGAPSAPAANPARVNQTPDGSGPQLGPEGVSRGVQMGYQVIEEYLRQGQQFAQSAWSASLSSGAGNGAGYPLPGDPAKLMTRMYQYASDLATAWLEYAQMTMGAAAVLRPPGPPTARPVPGDHVGGFDIEDPGQLPGNGQGSPGPTDAGLPPPVAIDITSRLRTEVMVDLRPGPVDALLVHDLRPADPKLRRIAGSRIERAGPANPVVFRIVIPEDQPPGTYSGLIVDEATNLPRGTLSLRLMPEGAQ